MASWGHTQPKGRHLMSEPTTTAELRGTAVRRLAKHRRMMRENAAWLDQVAGRRAEAEDIERELAAFIRRIPAPRTRLDR
jgi:hypothetical protein